MEYKKQSTLAGFTIVELLIVIVVIGILAAITLVAYNGIQNRARTASVSSGLNQVAKKVALQQVDSPGVYPADKTALLALGITESGSLTYQYSVNNVAVPATYCVTATDGNVSYYLNNTTTLTPTSGGCAGHGVGGVEAVTNLAINPSAEGNTGWYSNNSATIPKTWDSTVARSGLRSVEAHSLSDSASLLSIYAAAGSDGNGFSISSTANTYTISAYFKADVAHQGSICAAHRVGGVWSTTTYGSWASGSIGSWSRASHTVAVPDGADKLRVCMSVNATSVVPAGTKGWADDMIVTQGANTPSYADGSSPNWIWNGAANNSTSTGPSL